jgi:hypothetical protein
MRKLLFVGCLPFLSVSMAAAQGKVTTQWTCGKPSPVHAIQPGDQPDHAYSISQVKCTATAGEIAGVKQKEGVGTEFHEITASTSRFRGTFVETLANGDKIIYSYEGTAKVKPGVLESADNKWSAASGTGAFKGIKANGTCKGTGNPDGTTTFACAGDYSTPK